MLRLTPVQVSTLIASVTFVTLAPFLVDTYNTLNHRGFMDLLWQGNPFSLAVSERLSFRGREWLLDWPYPPLTLVLELPAWFMYQITHSEWVYQLFFKLPLFVSSVMTQILVARRIGEHDLEESVLPFSYVLNVSVILSTTVAGAYDVLVAFLIFWAYDLYRRGSQYSSVLVLGVAGALRFYPFILLPVYMLDQWKRVELRWHQWVWYLILAFSPLVLSFLPFVMADWNSLINVLARQQLVFGPFATVNFVSSILDSTTELGKSGLGFEWLGVLFVVFTVIGLMTVYFWMCKSSPTLPQANLMTLLVFFLFYPKVHGLYLVALLPLALLNPKQMAAWVWLPGAIWMLTINGAFGSSGLYYWLAPMTGLWIDILPDNLAAFLDFLLPGVQAGLLIKSIYEIATPAKSSLRIN